ncbi:hypothetical protein [Flavobacterium alkalisoli]|uniref:hypothetical protein n=1 Tax=Flavobacterium alkalisoli TaxID=2602769 RepID=UPI003A903173
MYKTLYKTTKLELKYLYETVYLSFLAKGKTVRLGDIYGDALCGIISDDDDWAIAAGNSLIIWTPEKTETIEDTQLINVFAMRIVGKDTVNLLTDPWSDKAAVWEFNPISKTLLKLYDFPNYINKPYTDTIEW